MTTRQCEYSTKDRANCVNTTHYIGRKGILKKICAYHLREEECFIIQPSGIGEDAGDGLFTTTHFKKDAPVLEYVGEVLSKAKAKKLKNPYRDYLSWLADGRVVDAANKDKSSLARYANDAHKSDFDNNLFQYMAEKTDYEPVLKRNPTWTIFYATKDINGTKDNPVELFLDYGTEYWATETESEEEEDEPRPEKKQCCATTSRGQRCKQTFNVRQRRKCWKHEREEREVFEIPDEEREVIEISD